MFAALLLVVVGAYGAVARCEIEFRRLGGACDHIECQCRVDAVASTADCEMGALSAPFVAPNPDVANGYGSVDPLDSPSTAAIRADFAIALSVASSVADGDERPPKSFLAYRPFSLRAPPLA